MNTKGKLLCEIKNPDSCQVAQKKAEGLSFSGISNCSNSPYTNKHPQVQASLPYTPFKTKKKE